MPSAVAPFVDRADQQGKERVHQGHSCNFRPPVGNKASGVRSVRGHRGLRKRLHAAKKVASRLPSQGRDYAYAAPRVGPDLKIWAVPQDGEAQLSRLGLSLPRNSQGPTRTGLKGITHHGKKQVRWSCRLLEGRKGRLAMCTVSLLDSDYVELAKSGNWPVFQRRFFDRLMQLLKAHGDEAVAVGVCEIGAKRFARTGRPDPHIHVVTTGWGRRHPDGGWLLSPDRMDDLVSKACQDAGLPLAERRAASQVAKVKFSVASYMSKYLTKELPVDVGEASERCVALIPHQWWNQSAACKAMVDGCLFKLPPAFAAFVVRQVSLLEGLNLGRGGYRTVGHKKTLLCEVPIELFCFSFRSPECLIQGLELFALWDFNGEELDPEGLVMSG